jgi:hypothetical protein
MAARDSLEVERVDPNALAWFEPSRREKSAFGQCAPPVLTRFPIADFRYLTSDF